MPKFACTVSMTFLLPIREEWRKSKDGDEVKNQRGIKRRLHEKWVEDRGVEIVGWGTRDRELDFYVCWYLRGFCKLPGTHFSQPPFSGAFFPLSPLSLSVGELLIPFQPNICPFLLILLTLKMLKMFILISLYFLVQKPLKNYHSPAMSMKWKI